MSALTSLFYAFPVFSMQNRRIATLELGACSMAFYEPNLGFSSPLIDFDEAFNALSTLFTEPVRAKAVVADFTDDGNPDAMLIGWMPGGQSHSLVPVGVFTRWLTEEIACGLIPLSPDVPRFIEKCAEAIINEPLYTVNDQTLTLVDLPKTLPVGGLTETVIWRNDNLGASGLVLSADEVASYQVWCNTVLPACEKIKEQVGQLPVKFSATGIDLLHRYLFMHWQVSTYPESKAVLSWAKAYGTQDPDRFKEALLDPDNFSSNVMFETDKKALMQSNVRLNPLIFHFEKAV